MQRKAVLTLCPKHLSFVLQRYLLKLACYPVATLEDDHPIVNNINTSPGTPSAQSGHGKLMLSLLSLPDN